MAISDVEKHVRATIEEINNFLDEAHKRREDLAQQQGLNDENIQLAAGEVKRLSRALSAIIGEEDMAKISEVADRRGMVKGSTQPTRSY